jgi:adenylate cyclase
MSAADGGAADIGRIDLSQEAPLTLGPLSIDPALRRIVHRDGREEIVEPRIMRVLVALIRAEGRILSRDDLLMSCWHGVVVGEDAIDRVIGRLRRLADGIGGGEFKLETITRVGYRLVSTDARRAPAPAPATPDKVSICVLPFANMSIDPEQAYFSDGITEDIITDLSKVSSLFVVARTTAFTLRDKGLDIPQVARDLNVGHVLEGSVRKAEGRVRITAQLIDGVTGGHLWAERYDRDLKDIFALQDEISEAIVQALKVKLLPDEKRAIEQRGTTDPEAYNLYLMARRFYVTGSDGDLRSLEAVERLCQGAVEIDPGYGRAWALLGAAQTLTAFDHARPGENGLAALERALALGGEAAEARAFRARHLWEQDRAEAALAEIEAALALDPDSWAANAVAGRISYVQHRFDDAIRYWEKATSLPDSAKGDPGMLMSCYFATGDMEGARRAAAISLERLQPVLLQDHVNGGALGCGASALAVLGDMEAARDLMRRALLVDPDNLRMRYNFACSAMLHFKDPDMAIRMLEPVFAKIPPSLLRHAAVDPDLVALRDDPRYVAMARAAELRTSRAEAMGRQ